VLAEFLATSKCGSPVLNVDGFGCDTDVSGVYVPYGVALPRIRAGAASGLWNPLARRDIVRILLLSSSWRLFEGCRSIAAQMSSLFLRSAHGGRLRRGQVLKIVAVRLLRVAASVVLCSTCSDGKGELGRWPDLKCSC